jgi:hypothetical protein
MTIANSMLSLIGSLQPDPFSSRHTTLTSTSIDDHVGAIMHDGTGGAEESAHSEDGRREVEMVLGDVPVGATSEEDLGYPDKMDVDNPVSTQLRAPATQPEKEKKKRKNKEEGKEKSGEEKKSKKRKDKSKDTAEVEEVGGKKKKKLKTS